MENQIKSIKVNASKSYSVLIGKNLIQKTGELLLEVLPSSSKVALITDDTVDSLYASIIESSLKDNGYKVAKFVFKHGEESKNLTTYAEILNFLAQNEFTRTDAVIALGGGVVGDMAGFASATYLRGIKYIQIPTTLLAQIDSSVGGKTAIDLSVGKNLVGAFCQPSLVICDTETLKTLPKEIYLDGMGEAVKYAFLDKKIYNLLLSEFDVLDLVYLCIDYKRQVVEEDEFESGKRKLLNLGHTPAHAIEKLSSYKISHGKAVSLGLQIILKSSLKHGYIDKKTYEDSISLLENNVGIDKIPYSIEEICSFSLNDKKRSGDDITLVMVCDAGESKLEKIKVSELLEYLQ